LTIFSYPFFPAYEIAATPAATPITTPAIAPAPIPAAWATERGGSSVGQAKHP